jgi:hypothetical protein
MNGLEDMSREGIHPLHIHIPIFNEGVKVEFQTHIQRGSDIHFLSYAHMKLSCILIIFY